MNAIFFCICTNNSFKVNTEHLTSFDTDGQSYSMQKMSYLGKRSQRTISINLEYRFGAFQKKRYIREESSYEVIKNTDVEF